jgi:hypothetical protein
MLLLAVEKQQLALETRRSRKEAAKEKVRHAHKEKNSLIKCTAQVHGEEKAKDQLQKQKLDKATSHLSMAASAIKHQNYVLRGGTFPLPTPTKSYHDNIGGVSIRACPMSPSLPILTNSNLLYFSYYYRTLTN